MNKEQAHSILDGVLNSRGYWGEVILTVQNSEVTHCRLSPTAKSRAELDTALKLSEYLKEFNERKDDE
jgi:hypothetical protein